MLHEIEISTRIVHWGHYDASLEPILRVESGDLVKLESMSLPKGVGTDFSLIGLSDKDIPSRFMKVLDKLKDRGPGGHTLTGPIYVENSEPRDVLEVEFKEIELSVPFGYTSFKPGFGTLPERFPYSKTIIINLDIENKTAELPGGVKTQVKPFFGSIGVAPPLSSGRISSRPPGFHGGNLDNKELTCGSKIFIPVHTKGALLSIGDGHALQGDGEVSGTAVETSLCGLIKIKVRKDMEIKWPIAETPTHIVTMGFHQDLNKAMKIALWNTIDYLTETQNLEEDEAYVLSSIIVDFHITQTVNGVKGVHGLLPKTLLKY
jgi:acetamidase/formamidase